MEPKVVRMDLRRLRRIRWALAFLIGLALAVGVGFIIPA
jgi:hypothetical protein